MKKIFSFILVLFLVSFLFIGCGTPTNDYTFTFEYYEESSYVPYCKKHRVKCYETKQRGRDILICPKCGWEPVDGFYLGADE